MGLLSLFKPRQDAFTLGRYLSTQLLLERSPLENAPCVDLIAAVNQSLLLQFFLLNFAAMHRWGDEGPGERMLHGLRAGFSEKYPHLAAKMGDACITYARMMGDDLSEAAFRKAASHYCTLIGSHGDMLSVMGTVAWITMTLTNFHNTLEKLATERRLS